VRQTLYTENFEYNMGGQAILLAFEAILGHRSAHSLATGPVMALPANFFFYKITDIQVLGNDSLVSLSALITNITNLHL
jgi:hypothetical protein